MDRNSVFGIILVFLVILIAIFLIGDLLSYLSIVSILITIFGTFGAVAASNKGENIRNLPFLFRKFLVKDHINYSKCVITLISFSEKARREGLLALEDDIDYMEDPFFKNAIRLVIDGTDPEIVKQILEKEINSMKERHEDNIIMVNHLAEISPAFGLIGTVIGLIGVLGGIGGDITILGQQMSVALLTTLYGIVMSNGIWGPMGKKLEKKSNEESFNKLIIIEGILSLQFGDNPRILEQKLMSFFSISQKKNFKESNENKE